MRKLSWMVGLFLLCLPWAHSQAYERVRTQGNIPVAWPQMPITYFIGQSGSGQVSDKSDIEAIHQSFRTWEAVSCANISFSFGGLVDSPRATQNPKGSNQNHIFWVHSKANWPHPEGVLAVTTLSWEPHTGIIYDADLAFNGYDFKWSTKTPPPPDHYDIQNTATHEIGHILGLDHSSVTDSTMYGDSSARETQKRDLHQDDVKGICTIYPDNQPSFRFTVTDKQLGLEPCKSPTNTTPQGCQQSPLPQTPFALFLAFLLWFVLRLWYGLNFQQKKK